METVNEGGVNEHPALLYKQKSQAEALVLERGIAVKPELKSTRLKAGTMVKGGIVLVRNGRMLFKAYSFEEGIITRWEMSALDAMGKDVLIEKLEIRHSGLEEISGFEELRKIWS